jgi:hypothetical protein
MTTYVEEHPSSFGRLLMVFVVLVVVVVGAAWLSARHNDHRTLGQKVGQAVGNTIDAIPATVSKAADDIGDKQKLAKVGSDLKNVGNTASSALSKTGEAASSALSQTSQDLKAAAAKQKAQDRAAGKDTGNDTGNSNPERLRL